MEERRGVFIIGVIACWIFVISGQDLSNGGLVRCNATSCDKSPGYELETLEKSAPHGINDKTHYKDADNNTNHPYDRNGPYWLVPPFLIGASTVIVIYIIAHCLYLHCYATKKMKKLVQRQYPPAIVISDEPTSTGSYKTFTPVLRYNEQGELVDGQQFVFYQPFDDDEWERQLELRRCSSAHSSFRSSIKSSSSRKKSISLQLPKFLGGKRPSVSSTMSADKQTSPDDRGSPKPPRVCLVPVGRSLSVPGTSDKQKTSQGYLYSPVVLARTQSCKSPSTKRPSVHQNTKINGSASDGDLLPQMPLPQIIIGNGDSVVVHQSATDGATSMLAPAQLENTQPPTTSSVPSTMKQEVTSTDKMETQVLFHVGDADEAEVHLCDIKEEHEG